MKNLTLHSNIHDYEVSFEQNFEFIEKLIALEKRVFIIDKTIYELYSDYFESVLEEDLFLLDAIEENKTLKSVELIYRFLATKNAKRNITLISIGGGITQDVTGFVASTLYRGIQWIFIPTTFLAQADSCIGSKTSLNFETYKNIIGGFYPPHRIHIQPDFLKTLSKKDFYSGIGEVIKFALLAEAYPKNIDAIVQTVDRVTQHTDILNTIKQTMEIKKAYIDEDEFDTGKRNLFNYGHCFGHALENASHYEIPHGIAVTIGMIYANIVAYNRQLICLDFLQQLNERLFLPNIPMKLTAALFDKTILLESMKNDKKRVGKALTIVIPSDEDIRAIKINDLTFKEFELAYDQLLEILLLS